MFRLTKKSLASLPLSLALAVVACDAEPAPPDGGRRDAQVAREDGAPRGDAGASTRDAGASPRDAGPAAARDAGPTPRRDGGPSATRDAGPAECTSGPGCEPLSAARAEAIVARHVDRPFPDLDTCWGDVTYAYAALHLGREVADANARLARLTSRYSVPDDPTVDPDEQPCHFASVLIARILEDPTSSARLSAAARAELLEFAWRTIRRRSRVDDGLRTTWAIHESENHDLVRKTGYLLFAEALRDAGREGDVLADGLTVENHRTAWQRYFKEYLRERAREGLFIEIASPIYGKYSLSTIQNLRDFAASGEVRQLAGDLLTLHWADLAQDFLPTTGVRGGAMSRCYKDRYVTRGTYDGTRPMTFIYGWHDAFSGATNPATLAMATSDYRPPAVVSAMATRPRPGAYVSRRPGAGSESSDAEGIHYAVNFDGGGSAIRRHTYRTPEYVLGTMTFALGRNYTELVDQNRAMGVVFDSGVDHRIIVHGLGTRSNGRTGSEELQGISGEAAAVIVRHPSARNNGGMRIYVSYGEPWDNRVEEGGWLFTRAGDAFAAVRPASGGWVVHSVEDGKMLDLPDADAPIVLQLGRAADHASFAAFRAAVRGSRFDYAGGRLTYVSLAGERYEVRAGGTAMPTIDGATPSLNPARTYDSGFLRMQYGESTVRLSYPGEETVTLDFR